MGVPGLSSWLYYKFKRHVTNFKKGEFTARTDCMYFDANGLLHKAAQMVFKYGAYAPKNTSEVVLDTSEVVLDTTSYEQKLFRCFELFFEDLKAVLKIVTPKTLLYIAIDGPAPVAKQDQQRQRRFIAAEERLKKSASLVIFDSNCITPGTQFMSNLTRYTQFAVRRLINSFPEYKNLEVIFSPPMCPGEGEHKIMDYIRKTKNILYKQTHCMYGPDADLIMLCFATHLPHITLLKEDQREGQDGYYYHINMGEIRLDLPKVLRLQYDNVKSATRFSSKRSYDEISDDFLIQGFFVGNDFLPKIQMFHHLHDGLRFMIETYGKTSKNGTTNFLTINGKLNIDGFKKFLDYFVQEEQTYLINQIITTDERKQPPSEKYVNKTLLDKVKKDAKGGWTIDYEGYRKAYYKKAWKDKEPTFFIDQAELFRMCRDYLLTFVWIYDYYVLGVPSWTWRYSYHHAPLMKDFANYVYTLDQKKLEDIYKSNVLVPSVPVSAFEQLIAVLPPASANLLPKEYSEILVSKNSELVKQGFYPENFERDFEGKLKEHEAHVLLPFMDYNILHKEYKNIVSKKKYNRNTQTGSYSFKYNSKYTASFKSDMGNIPSLHVEKKNI